MGEFMKNQRNYYTVVPSQVLSDTRLTATARIVFGVIENLTHKIGECYASNDYITSSMGDVITDRTLRRALESLEDCGYIDREIKTAKGAQNERIIKMSNRWKSEGLLKGGADTNDRTARTQMSDPYNNEEKQSSKRISLARVRADEIFKKIWLAYDANRRGSEKKAYEAYVQAVTVHSFDAQTILDAIPKYLNSSEVQDKKKKQYLSNWLDNGGYNTEYAPAKPKPIPYVKPPRSTMPAITAAGFAIWTSKDFRARLYNRTFDTVFERWVKDWCSNNAVHPEVIKKTMDWINWEKYDSDAELLARKWFMLGNQSDLTQLFNNVAEEWWGHALHPIEHKNCTYDDKKAEWRDLCKQWNLPHVFIEFDPAECWDKKRKFYAKIGWKI